MIKNKKSLKGAKTPSRRKFFKAAAATGAAAATAVAMPNVAFGAPLTLKDASSLAFRRKHLF
jgi:FtsP/CotA-like multicopper oxidase with cupredoxin domain